MSAFPAARHVRINPINFVVEKLGTNADAEKMAHRLSVVWDAVVANQDASVPVSVVHVGVGKVDFKNATDAYAALNQFNVLKDALRHWKQTGSAQRLYKNTWVLKSPFWPWFKVDPVLVEMMERMEDDARSLLAETNKKVSEDVRMSNTGIRPRYDLVINAEKSHVD